METKRVYSIDAIIGKFKIESKLNLTIMVEIDGHTNGYTHAPLDNVLDVIPDSIRYSYKCMINCELKGSPKFLGVIMVSFIKCKEDEELYTDPNSIRLEDMYNILPLTALTTVVKDGVELLSPTYKAFYDVAGPNNSLVEVKINPKLFNPDFEVYITDKKPNRPTSDPVGIPYEAGLKIGVKDGIPYTLGNHHRYTIRYPDGTLKCLILTEILLI